MDHVIGEGAGSAAWESLRRQIEALRPLLERQGSLVRQQRRGRSYWRLRFYEDGPSGRKQRSLYVGDEANAQRMHALLVEIRAPSVFLHESLRLAELACHAMRPLRRRDERCHS